MINWLPGKQKLSFLNNLKLLKRKIKEELMYTTIAKQLGVSPVTVRQRCTNTTNTIVLFMRLNMHLFSVQDLVLCRTVAWEGISEMGPHSIKRYLQIIDKTIGAFE